MPLMRRQVPVAGTADSGTVVVRKKKRKTQIFKVTPQTFARFSKVKRNLKDGINI